MDANGKNETRADSGPGVSTPPPAPAVPQRAAVARALNIYIPRYLRTRGTSLTRLLKAVETRHWELFDKRAVDRPEPPNLQGLKGWRDEDNPNVTREWDRLAALESVLNDELGDIVDLKTPW